MIKFKAKSIENIAERAKERMLGKNGEGARIGILVSCENFSGARNYGLKLAYNVQNTILKAGYETEIISLPTICDMYKEYTSENNLINIYKEQLASMVELILTEKAYDGLVLIPKGISSKMGMIKGSLRQNLPMLVLGEGPSAQSNPDYTIKGLTNLAGLVAKGKLSSFDMQEAENNQIEYVGDGADFNTSNLFNVLLEVLGLSPMGNSTTFASTIARENLVINCSKSIVALVKNRFSPRKLITKKAITNAIVTNFALGASTSCLEYILEIAKELDIDINIDKALAMLKSVPTLLDGNESLEVYANLGGTIGILKTLSSLKLIDEGVKTYTETSLGDLLKNSKIKALEGYDKKESLIEFRGNIAERKAFCKSANTKDLTTFEGKVRVFDNDDSASYAVLSKAINPNTVIAIKNGSKDFGGGNIPYQTVRALEAFELTNSVVVLTESNIPDSTKAIVIGNITPSGDDGNLRLLQDDDLVEIDFVKGKLNVDLTGKEINQRAKKFIKDHQQNPTFVKQYLKLLNK